MAKNDYPVIVYQILSYLYSQLKEGKQVEPDALTEPPEMVYRSTESR